MNTTPHARARRSLEGLSVGDAFGQTFFGPDGDARIAPRELMRLRWFWTDDTAMALCIYECLRDEARLSEDSLARRFADRYANEDWRGYGAYAHDILAAIYRGKDWRVEAQKPFHGQGSMGNGSAMRAAPIGAWFADDLEEAIRQAVVSARPTHLHPEGVAGAIAVTVMAALAAQGATSPDVLFKAVLDATPWGKTHDLIKAASDLPKTTAIPDAVELLGNGSHITCPDTVPLCLWLAAHHVGDFEEALWATVSARGDIDTNGAIVGGIVAAAGTPIPAEWIAAREPLPV